jgi:Ras-related protein Rab-21
MATSAVSFKVVLLGEGRVGKTCLCLRYCQGVFSDGQESTIQATYLDKRLNLGKRSVKLMIWDTAGQERFHALGPIYYRDAQGALLVYDITDRDSFTKVRVWVKELRRIVGKNIVLVIAGNKCDLMKRCQVDVDEAKQYADSVGAVHMLVSAKANKNVEQAFLEITKQMLQAHRSSDSEKTAESSNRTLIGISKEMEKTNEGGCC